jgi:hypothetical protein
LFDHLVTTGEQDAIIIQAARLTAILLRIAQDLRHAEAVLNQEAVAIVRRGASILKQNLMINSKKAGISPKYWLDFSIFLLSGQHSFDG